MSAVVLLHEGEPHEIDGEPVCPACGSDDTAMWADDGESWAADWWSCEDCDAFGAVVLADDLTRTQNGCEVGTWSR